MSTEAAESLPRDRPGLNASEAAIAWAYARFGGDPKACEVLAGDAGAAVRALVDPVLDADERERDRLVEHWRRQDRRWDSLDALVERLPCEEVTRVASLAAPRWRRALERISGRAHDGPYPWHDNSVRTRRAIVWLAVGALREAAAVERPELRCARGFDLDMLVEMASVEREEFIRHLGVFQLAELARHQDRRSLVRLRRALHDDDRGWFDACIRREREVERVERSRLRELFLAVSRQEPDLTARLLHLGLYSISAASGVRFGAKLRHVAAQLSPTLETLLLHYQRLDADSPAGLAPAFRRALDEYADRYATADTEGGQP